KKNGGFDDVKLQVTPEATGLRVLFVLQPAYYFGVFKFSEAVNRFSYTRLLQAVNYERQEPYTKARIEEAESNLLDFFHQTGFFLATVEPELQTDSTHRVVNVMFRVRLKRHANFGAIRFEGASPAVTQKLEGSLRGIRARLRGVRLKTGGSYSVGRLQRATTFPTSQLGKQNYLAGTVRVASSKYNPVTNRADITFHVNTGPEITIKIIGGSMSGRTQRRIIPIYEENAVD